MRNIEKSTKAHISRRRRVCCSKRYTHTHTQLFTTREIATAQHSRTTKSKRHLKIGISWLILEYWIDLLYVWNAMPKYWRSICNLLFGDKFHQPLSISNKISVTAQKLLCISEHIAFKRATKFICLFSNENQSSFRCFASLSIMLPCRFLVPLLLFFSFFLSCCNSMFCNYICVSVRVFLFLNWMWVVQSHRSKQWSTSNSILLCYICILCILEINVRW